MTRTADKSKRHFDGNTAVSVSNPQVGATDTYFYLVSGPDGGTEHHVAVRFDERPQGSSGNAGRRSAETIKDPRVFELRNIRNDLVRLGPSLGSGLDVLAQLWRIEIAEAQLTGKPPRIPYARRAMRHARPDASLADIDEALLTDVSGEVAPTRRTVGEACKVTCEVWEANNSPRYVHPVDRPSAWIEAALAAKAGIKRRSSNRKYRAKHQNPRKTTKSEIARGNGMSRTTLWRKETAEKAAKEVGKAEPTLAVEPDETKSRDSLRKNNRVLSTEYNFETLGCLQDCFTADITSNPQQEHPTEDTMSSETNGAPAGAEPIETDRDADVSDLDAMERQEAARTAAPVDPAGLVCYGGDWVTPEEAAEMREHDEWELAKAAYRREAAAERARGAIQAELASVRSDRPGAKEASQRAATGRARPAGHLDHQDRPTTFSAPSYRKARP